MRILLKIGGATLERPEARAQLACAVSAGVAQGHELIVAHGGGNQIRALSRRLGIADRYVEGLRVTDAETAEVVLATLCGTVGKTLVAALAGAGVPAVGLSGADGRVFEVRRHPAADLGYVGVVSGVRTSLLETLLATGYLPVVACVGPLAAGAPGPRDHLYNVNADDVAVALAGALAVDALLFLTDVPAVLDGAGGRIATMDPVGAAALEADGVLSGGMLPKVRAGLSAAAALDGALVKIAPADGPDAVVSALEEGVGTSFESTRTAAGTPNDG